MSAIFRTIIFLLLMVLQGHYAIAGTQGVTVEVGGQSVYVPAPAGFHEISRLSPETRNLAETMTPPNNRLLAVFVFESDVGLIMKGESPELDRYMFLQTFRPLEAYNVSGPEFSRFLSQFKQEQDTIMEKAKAELGPTIDEMTRNISKDYGLLLKMKIGELVPLGCFLEKSDAAGYAYLSKYQVSIEGQQVDYIMAGGVSFIRVNGACLYANVYGNFETAKDIDWVRTTSTKWVDQILATNIGQGSSTKADYRRTSAPGFDWDKAIEKGMACAIAAVLIGVAIVAIKRLVGKKKEHDD